MKALKSIALVFCSALLFQTSAAFDFCYRAAFNTSVAVSGTTSSRSAEVESAVSDILEEFLNDTSLNFTVSNSNVTLNELEGDASSSLFIVSICLTNSSKDQNEFTEILQTFSITTQIESSTVEANDYDECANNYTTCSSLATCTNTNGSFTCECPEVYADRSTGETNGEVCELPTNHTCSSDVIEVSAYFPYFSSLGISSDDLTLGSCTGNVSGDVLSFSGACSPSMESNGTHLIYTWNLTNIPESPALTIGTFVTIPFTCVFVNSGNVTVNFNGSAAEPIVFGPNLISSSLEETIQVDIEAFRDFAFTNSLSVGSSIQTDQDLTFRMGPSAGYISDNIKTVCRGLTSAPAEGTSDPIQLVTGGCVESDPSYTKLLDSVELIDQGVGSTASLFLKSHFFANSRVTQLRFEIEICLATGGSSCQPTCSRRRRRSIVEARPKREVDILLGVGFFSFSKSENDRCPRDCGIGDCVFDAIRNQECLCPVSAYKDTDGACVLPTDHADTTTPTNNRFESEDTIPLLVGLIITAVALIAVAALIFFVAQKSNGKTQSTVLA